MEAYQGYHIIRCYEAGVFFAQIKAHDKANRIITLQNARKIFYWEGAAAVEQIAMEGVKNRAASKFTMVVPEMDVANPIQIIPCTREAVECINLVNVWKRT